MEIGIYTLADIGPNPLTNETISAKERLDEIIEAAKLADEAGLDIFGVGEHHRLDYAASSPAVILATIAQVTNRIRLTSTTSVLSTLDPVRLFEDFATVDLLSNGRAEIMAGRGAFIESFPLFGYRTDDYDELFEEHLQRLMELINNEKVTWKGKFRSSFTNAEIAPRPIQEKLPVWIGVGGSAESAIRAGRFGVGMAVAILSGEPKRFQPLVEHYLQAGMNAGHEREKLQIGITGHGFIRKTTEQAKDEFYPYYANYWEYVNRKRGIGVKMSRNEFDNMVTPHSALLVGSPEQVVEKVLAQYELFGNKRLLVQLDIGGQPFKEVAKSIELLATEIAPIVKRETAKR